MPSPAYHSALVEPGLEEMEATIATLSVSDPDIPLVSNLPGRVVESRMDGAYWRRHARQPVAFRSCVETLAQLGVDAVIEIGPHTILGPLVSLNWPQSPGNFESSIFLQSLLRPSFDGSEPERADAFVQAVADAYGARLPVDFTGLFAGEERRRISVPGYPFQRQRHWVTASQRRRSGDAHPLLGVRHESPHGDVMYETEMYPTDPAWLNDHQVYGRVVMPGAVYGAMAATVQLMEGGDASVVEELQLHNPLVYPAYSPDGDREAPGRLSPEAALQGAGDAGDLDIHPLLIDGCFQVFSATRNLSGIGGDATYLPFGWERLWLSGPLPDRLVCHARLRETVQAQGENEAKVQTPETLTGDLMLYTPEGDVIGGLTGFTVKRATRVALLSASEGLDDLLYEVVWRERPLVGTLQSAQALVGPQAAGEGMRTFEDYLSSEGVTIDDRAMLLSDLERLSRSYSLAALEQLGWQRRKGQPVEPDSLRDLLQIEPQHTKLVGRMLRLLKDGGLLTEAIEQGGYIVEVCTGDPLPDDALADPEIFADKMVERYPHAHNELNILRRSGAALADGLRGTSIPWISSFEVKSPA